MFHVKHGRQTRGDEIGRGWDEGTTKAATQPIGVRAARRKRVEIAPIAPTWKTPRRMTGAFSFLAEGQGFEPWSPGLPVKRFSRPPHSTALPPLRMGCGRLGFADRHAPFPAVRSRPGFRSRKSQNWRRDRDSNPRYAFGAHTISNRAPSASRSSLRSFERAGSRFARPCSSYVVYNS